MIGSEAQPVIQVARKESGGTEMRTLVRPPTAKPPTLARCEIRKDAVIRERTSGGQTNGIIAGHQQRCNIVQVSKLVIAFPDSIGLANRENAIFDRAQTGRL